jgi:hypothetical protein
VWYSAAGGVPLTTHAHAEVKIEFFPLVVCVAISGELYFTFAKSNKVCVVVMLKVQVMYIIFQ